MSKAKKRVFFWIAVAVAVYGIWYVNAHALPVYCYESSDRGMAEFEVPWKGRHFDAVESRFEKYKAWKGDPTITLCRTCERNWSAPNLWFENLTHRRWGLAYIPPSAEPKRDYYLAIPRSEE